MTKRLTNRDLIDRAQLEAKIEADCAAAEDAAARRAIVLAHLKAAIEA